MDRNIIWEGDTKQGHYQIVDGLYDGRPARVLYSGERQAAQSGIPKDDKPDLLFDYNQRVYELVTSLVPKRILLIGGGVFTLPTALLAVLPDTEIDVVEMDAGLTELAYEYFDLPIDDRLRIFHTDGRTFLRERTERYDMVLVDVFNHTAIPKDFKTIEAFQALHAHLNKGGILAMNAISGYHGPSAQVLETIYAATCQVFDTIDIFIASLGYSLWLPQNFVVTAQKNNDLPIKDYMRYQAVQPPDVNPNLALHD